MSASITPCNIAYDGDEKMAGVPIRLHQGSGDDRVNPAACRAPVAWLKPEEVGHHPHRVREQPAQLRHADTVASGRSAQGAEHAQLPGQAGPNGTLLDTAAGQPYDLKTASCVAIGTHVGHNAR